MAELTAGLVGAAVTVGAAQRTTGSSFTARHESSLREEMMETTRSMNYFMEQLRSGNVTEDEERELFQTRFEAIQRENGYHESIESYKRASWFNLPNKLKKRENVRREKHLTRQFNHRLRTLRESMDLGVAVSIRASLGSLPGHNLAVDGILDWTGTVYHAHAARHDRAPAADHHEHNDDRDSATVLAVTEDDGSESDDSTDSRQRRFETAADPLSTLPPQLQRQLGPSSVPRLIQLQLSPSFDAAVSILEDLQSLRNLDATTLHGYSLLFGKSVHLVVATWQELADIVAVMSTDYQRVHAFSLQDGPPFLKVNEFVTILMTENPWDTLLMLDSPWLVCISEIMQMVLDDIITFFNFDSEMNDKLRRRCLAGVQKIARSKEILPPRLFIRTLKRQSRNAVAGGGYADIWKGTIENETVCLKVLRVFLSDLDRPKLFKSFTNEVLIWRQLRHPNILPLLGINMNEFYPSFSLISPWLAQGDILGFLQTNPNHDRIRSIVEVSEGLKYLHERTPSIVHGDIRGANILVKDDGVCCLADFGIAVFAERHVSWTISSTSSIRGAVRWLAPELLDPEHQPKPSATRDIYSLGCTIYEIYTGNPPFAHIPNDLVVRSAVLAASRPSRPRDLEKLIPEFVWDLTQKCWLHEPSSRPTIKLVLDTLLDGQSASSVS
ncbi:kinase-like domain-containing protein [Mycena leptocephala]|nr:kinase-like domain-containing protein [Mycena leptocephala]